MTESEGRERELETRRTTKAKEEEKEEEKGAPAPSPPLKYPVGAFFILASYLLERFVYYGLFGGVVFYMQRVLRFSASTASMLKALTEGLIYLAPIPGAIVADTYLGKFRLVFVMCCIYVVGAAVFTLSSIYPMMASVGGTQATGMGGILVLGLSAGLMKAVFTSLGPDQFKLPEQRRQQQRFFYAFYWMINAGAFFGQILTAQLRSTVQCFGHDCYMLPFLILCGLMMLSTLVFYSGKKKYYETPPDTMLLDSIKCIAYASKKSITERSKRVDHWLERSNDKYDEKLIDDVKKTLRVLLLFVTYPLFWALFYQTSTGMIFQAKRLHDRIGSYSIPPEITSSINPLIILIIIPLFEFVIYPFLDRRNILKSTTKRMTLGMFLACISFLVYGVVNISVEQSIIGPKESQLNIYNPRNCLASISGDWFPEPIEILPKHEFKFDHLNMSEQVVIRTMRVSCESFSEEVIIKLEAEYETTIVLFPNEILVLNPTKDYLKDKDAEAKVRIITDIPQSSRNIAGHLTLIYKDLMKDFSFNGRVSEFEPVSPHNYTISIENATLGVADISQDGVYDIVMIEGQSVLFAMTRPSRTHMVWLFPQYLLITIGEVLFSVSSMDFAYSEAPTSMKSVMQAANLFTITIGLWVFAIFTKVAAATGIFNYRASNEAFTYAVIMFLNTGVFYLLARYYNKKNMSKAVKVPEENLSFKTDEI